MDFNNLLMKLAGIAANNKYLGSIRDAFTDYMPFTIIGAIGTLWTYVIVDPVSGLGSLIPAVTALSFLNPLFNALNFATIGCITLGVTFAISAQIAHRNGQNEIYAGIIGVAALMIVTCATVDPGAASVTLADGTAATVAELLPAGAVASLISAVSTGAFGATGLFTGMIVGIAAIELLNVLEKVEQFKIKLPDAVPPNIAGSFNALIPSTLTLLIVGAVGFVLQSLTGLYLNDLIFNLIQAPLQNVGGSFVGGIVFSLIITLFWCFGLHGNNMTSAVTTPLFTALLLENEAAVHAGQAPANIINASYWACFFTICGTGIALAITLAILFVGKREDTRAIAKLSLFPNCFNINETVVFGLPVVLNPPMCVGFVLAPLASYIISYVLTAVGFCPVMYINVPWTTPIILSGFLASGGNIMGAVTQIICLAVAVLIYIPCVKAYEASKNAEDAKAAELTE
ncbi:MAG: PTS sugar transporter subunit IIC [Atopobiaceae bacterium]|nr:PTS sugar transporter subunit IIC [Atopobiaceae bacterium]